MKRLIHAKQIFLHGVDHAGRPGELNRLFAVLAFDQAIEHFLNTVIYELRGKTKNAGDPKFQNLIDGANAALENHGKQKMDSEANILRVHRIRNNAQHLHQIPSSDDVSDARVYTRDFLTNSFQLCFSKVFDELFLADAIESGDVKQHFGEAEKALDKDDTKKSMEELGICFWFIESHFLAEDYEFRWDLDNSFVRSLSRVLSRIPDSSGEARQVEVQLDKFIGRINHELDYLRDRVMILSIGGNMPDYQLFRRIVPRVGRTGDGRFRVFHLDAQPSKEACLRALIFIYDLILAIQGLPSAES
ncbi:MAG: hypothetical protein V1784_09240 [bacterium]